MELTHSEPVQSVRFLNLLQVGLSETLAEMAPSEYIKTDTHEGVKFTFKDVQYTVLFRTDGIGGRFRAARQAEVLADQEFSNDVQKQAFEHLAASHAALSPLILNDVQIQRWSQKAWQLTHPQHRETEG